MKPTFRRFTKKQLGFTLIEIGIALALMGVGVFYVISKLAATNDKTKGQQVVSDLSEIVSGTKGLYATQPSYTGVTIASLRDNGVFPKAWNVSGTITGPWTGAVTVAAATLTTAGDAAALTIPGVPSQVCSDLARMMSSGIEQIDVAGTTVKANNGTLNIGTLGTQCVSSTNVAVTFTFGKM